MSNFTPSVALTSDEWEFIFIALGIAIDETPKDNVVFQDLWDKINDQLDNLES